jgi:hypothetical protein
MNDYPFKDFLDFSLLKLNEVYPKGLQISNLAHMYNREKEIWIDDKQQKHFLELYEYKQIEKYGTTWNYKITAETKVIVDNYGNYSSYIRHLAVSQLEKEKEENELKKLKIKNIELQNENLEFSKTIREQESRIRNLEEQNNFFELLKSYWWFILTCLGIGVTLGKNLDTIISCIS